MPQFTPTELSEREFTKSILGYNPAEVDAYINQIIENYAALYRENIDLSKRVYDLEKQLASPLTEDEQVLRTLETAQRAGDTIIEEAHGKADDVLTSVKAECEAILRNFRDKIAAQKKALAEIQETVHTFKKELFEKYRLHIELIEQLSPVYEYKKELSPEEYVDHIVSDLKQEVAAQYGISLDTIHAPVSGDTTVPTDNAPTVNIPRPTTEHLSLSRSTREISLHDAPPAKKPASSMMTLFDEDAPKTETNTNIRITL